MNRFQFVDDHQRLHGVKRLCQVIGVARSSYYHWKATADDRAARATDDARLAARIRVIHHESNGTYGVPRITAELHDTGHRVNHKRVARVMREVGLAGLRLRRRHRTTLADPTAAKAPTCSNATSPPRNRTPATSATSPTCRSPTARSATWPP